ncbi:MAG: formyl-CoA transferase, partial [Dehalococcoidia bacterium]|nr:formyl-CoA transferase [Dehalococcoidia bacterium]
MANASEGGALAGIRVLDLTDYQAGPACTQLLGMLGADVIKIEQPGFGGYTRTFIGDKKDTNSIWFLVLNANKRGVTINLQSKGGKEVLTALIKKSDILVENFAPGTIERLGFGWEHVHQLNPRLVYASIKGFGSTGPHSNFKVFEGIAQATGGAMFMCGTADTPPLNNGAAIGDSGTGSVAVGGILAAIIQRHRTGVGQFVDISQQDVILNLVRTHIRAHQALGRAPARSDRSAGGRVAEGLFACAPGGPNDYIVINIAGHLHMRAAFMDAIGRPDLTSVIAQAQEISEEEVLKHATEINNAITKWTMQRSKHEAMRILSAAGV